jgi:ABC-type sugar transport system substrate-binding protein/anti-anti-sigma regulatory factor
VHTLKDTPDIHIGFLYFDSLFWSMVNHSLQTEAERVGVKFASIPTQTSDDQMFYVKQLLAQGVNALLIESVSANVSEFIPVLDEIRANNLPLVFLNAEVEGHPEFCTVRSDHRKGQILVAEYLFEQLGGQGKVAYLQGVGKPGEIRREGFHSLLEQYPNIELVFEAQGRWLHEMGRELTRQALNEHADLQGVVAANDAMALGAIEAITGAGGTGEILVTGFDAIPEALIAIYREELIITARQSVHTMASEAIKMLVKTAKGDKLPSLVLTDVELITRDNLLHAATTDLGLLPKIFRDLADGYNEQKRLQAETIETQRQMIEQLSSPIIPLIDAPDGSGSIIAMPLVGAIDSLRARDITRSLLAGISQYQAQIVVLDLTGVSIIDSQVANYLHKTIQAARLKGARPIITGISEAVAESIVDLGIDWSGVKTLSDLQTGLVVSLNNLGIKLTR